MKMTKLACCAIKGKGYYLLSTKDPYITSMTNGDTGQCSCSVSVQITESLFVLVWTLFMHILLTIFLHRLTTCIQSQLCIFQRDIIDILQFLAGISTFTVDNSYWHSFSNVYKKLTIWRFIIRVVTSGFNGRVFLHHAMKWPLLSSLPNHHTSNKLRNNGCMTYTPDIDDGWTYLLWDARMGTFFFRFEKS